MSNQISIEDIVDETMEQLQELFNDFENTVFPLAVKSVAGPTI